MTRLAAALPAVFLWCSVAVISGLFFAADYRGITRFFARCTPPRLAQVLYLVKDCVQRSALQMAKSYLILMAVTFAELAAGFWLLGIAHPVSMALLVALSLIHISGGHGAGRVDGFGRAGGKGLVRHHLPGLKAAPAGGGQLC